MGKEESDDRPAGSAAPSGGGGKLDDYRMLGKLGEGTFSEVIRVKQKKTGRISAMKRFRKHFKSYEEIETLREIQALRRLNPHQHIVDLEEVIFEPKNGQLNLNFELMECNLYELISQRKTAALLTEGRARLFMHQICKALEYIHGKGIFHRDIKPENILVKDNNIKIADFGSCRGIHSKQPYTEYIATRWYRPPECLLTQGFYSYKMDIWGAGCVLFEIVSRVPLFPGCNELDQLHRIHAVLGSPKKELLRYLAGSKASALKYSFPPKEGTGIRALIPHVGSDCVDLINALLAYNPDERISSKDALRSAYFRDMPADGGESVTAPMKGRSARRKSLHASNSNVQLTTGAPVAVAVKAVKKGEGDGEKQDGKVGHTSTSYLKSSKAQAPAAAPTIPGGTHGSTTTKPVGEKAPGPDAAAHGTSNPPRAHAGKSAKPSHLRAQAGDPSVALSQHPNGGTLLAVPQAAPARTTGPYITSIASAAHIPYTNATHHSNITTTTSNVSGATIVAANPSAAAAAAAAAAAPASSLSLPPIHPTAVPAPATSAFYAKFKQDDSTKRAAPGPTEAGAASSAHAARLRQRLRASAGTKKGGSQQQQQLQGSAAQSADQKGMWGNAVVGKTAVASSHKLPHIAAVPTSHHSKPGAPVPSSSMATLPHLPGLAKHDAGADKSRPKDMLVLPSLGGPDKTTAKTSAMLVTAAGPTLFPQIKQVGSSQLKPTGK
ncbi:hypothetical protein HKX48_008209 [Thoreauomyces humboldtii]|nr:hypothetical protein HKX48_008209 [Thoreauomyces humboldtii]